MRGGEGGEGVCVLQIRELVSRQAEEIGSPLETERVCSSDHLKSVAFGFSWSFSRNQCKHMCWVDEMLQAGNIKSNGVVYHHDGQCHDFHVIYDDYETRDDRHGVGDDIYIFDKYGNF